MYGDQIITQKSNAYTKLNAFIPYNATIGIGLSIPRKTITFVYENFTESYELNFSSKMSIIPIIREAMVPNTFDNISVNFGKYPFKYDLPGFISYQKYQNIMCSCRQNSLFNFQLNFAFLHIFIVI